MCLPLPYLQNDGDLAAVGGQAHVKCTLKAGAATVYIIDGGQPARSMISQAASTCRLPLLRLKVKWAGNSASNE
jgi:hypothetical protein